MRTQSFNEAYRELLEELYDSTLMETNSRTGVQIKMLEGGHSFKLDLSSGRLPVAGNRRYWPRIAAAETAWQFMGTQDPTFILEMAPKIWSDFVEDGKLKTAYGYRWRRHFGRDQLAMARQQLQDNPTNRQLFLSAWDPATDGLGGPDQPKNIPCPLGFSLTRTEDLPHCSLFIRSSDVFVGLPYDVMGYALTTAAIAESVDIQPGTMHVTLAHPHYYDPHAEAIRDSVDGLGDHAEWRTDVEPTMPLGWTVDYIVRHPRGYVSAMTGLSAGICGRQDWNPMPELVL